MPPSHLDSGFDSDVHIVSFVVQAVAEYLPELSEALKGIDGVEVHASDACGKLIVTAESDSARGVSDVFDQIRELPGVLAVSLVYHQVEDRAALEQEIKP